MMVAGGLVPNRHKGDCFTNVSRDLQNSLSKFVYCRNHTSYENSKLKFCTCAQSKVSAWNSHIDGIIYFRDIILESSRNVSETTPGHQQPPCWLDSDHSIIWVYYATSISNYVHHTNYVQKRLMGGQFAGSFVIDGLVFSLGYALSFI